mgnify:CR=1 FL=1
MGKIEKTEKHKEEQHEEERLTNVFYDEYHDMVRLYKGEMEIWDKAKTLSLIDTGPEVGLFNKSDIIIAYDQETDLPNIVTERIFSRNYTKVEWYKLRRNLLNKTKVITQELGFNIQISFGINYLDYIHYKEDWWKWAIKFADRH